MQDCKLIITVRDNKVNLSGQNTSAEAWAYMCGALMQSIGLIAYKAGMSLDDIKNNLYDIYFGAMESLTDQIIAEMGEMMDGKEETAD